MEAEEQLEMLQMKQWLDEGRKSLGRLRQRRDRLIDLIHSMESGLSLLERLLSKPQDVTPEEVEAVQKTIRAYEEGWSTLQ